MSLYKEPRLCQKYCQNRTNSMILLGLEDDDDDDEDLDLDGDGEKV